MTKRKVAGDEYETICEMLYQLTDILLAVGVVELKISKGDKEIYWDTEGGGLVDPEQLESFSRLINKHYMGILEKMVHEPT